MPVQMYSRSSLAFVVSLACFVAVACGGSGSSQVSDVSASNNANDHDIPDETSAIPTFDGTALEHLHAFAACLENKGYAATVDESDMSLSWNYSEDIDRECMLEVGELAPLPLTDAQIRDLYEQELRTKACLEGLEFEVPDPISEDQYVQEYQSSSGPSWYAYLGVPEQLGPTEWQSVNDECPQPSL